MATTGDASESDLFANRLQDVWVHARGPLLQARQIAWRYIKVRAQPARAASFTWARRCCCMTPEADRDESLNVFRRKLSTFAVLSWPLLRKNAGLDLRVSVSSSHQNDPGRTILEILLIFFVIRTWTQSRTRSEASGRNFVKLSEKVSVFGRFASGDKR